MVIQVSDMAISHKCFETQASSPLSLELFNFSLEIGRAAMVGIGEGDVHDIVTMLWLIGGLILMSHH